MCFVSLLAVSDWMAKVPPGAWWTVSLLGTALVGGNVGLGLYCLNLRRDLAHERQECARKDQALIDRPDVTYPEYHIATVGHTGCGKTALMLKFTCPFIDIKSLNSTNIEDKKYPKVVSYKNDSLGTIALHKYHFHDYPGEKPDLWREEIQALDIRGILIVVDVAETVPDPEDPKKLVVRFSEKHIERQLTEVWPRAALKVFFGKRIQTHLKKYILFINKLDVLQEQFPESDAQLEKRARALFKPMIDNLKDLGEQNGAEVTILVGSALTGRGCLDLSRELLAGILPQEAWDESLQQANLSSR